MKKIIIICLLAVLCSMLNAQPLYAQSNTLNVQRKMPEALLKSIERQSKSKPQYYILDFFETWCGPCIKALPKLDSLQKQFEGNIQIIAITSEKTAKIKTFLRSKPSLASIQLPFITGDSILNAFFPHTLLPHEVIIDQNGNVVASTYAAELTAANINSLLKGNQSVFAKKNDNRSFDTNQPLLTNLPSKDMVKTQTTLTGYIPGVGTKFGVKKDETYARYYFINMPLLDLLQLANGRPSKSPYKLNVADSNQYVVKKENKISWAADHYFCYAIVVPSGIPLKEVHRFMLDDLESRFKVSTSIVVPASGHGLTPFLLVTENIQHHTNALNN